VFGDQFLKNVNHLISSLNIIFLAIVAREVNSSHLMKDIM
jgi:hypothetical protein